jgi:hypothetical protein
MSETSFKIAVPDDNLALLRAKLDLVTFPDELQDAGWNYGAPLADIRRLVARWKDGYKWRKHEAELNQLPQFTRDIDVDGHGTLNIHYVHQKSDVVDAIPLLFVHGCMHTHQGSKYIGNADRLSISGPGSLFEVRKILPLLTATSTDHPSFHVVALSLPGYGFSEAPSKKGFGTQQYAEVYHLLLRVFGLTYVAPGRKSINARSWLQRIWSVMMCLIS